MVLAFPVVCWNEECAEGMTIQKQETSRPSRDIKNFPIFSAKKKMLDVVAKNSFQYLDLDDTFSCLRVCSSWAQQSENDSLWKHNCERDFPEWSKDCTIQLLFSFHLFFYLFLFYFIDLSSFFRPLGSIRNANRPIPI